MTIPSDPFTNHNGPSQNLQSQGGVRINIILSAAVIDTDVFLPHSIRGAASTAAASQGITFENIHSTGGWSKALYFLYGFTINRLSRFVVHLLQFGSSRGQSRIGLIKIMMKSFRISLLQP